MIIPVDVLGEKFSIAYVFKNNETRDIYLACRDFKERIIVYSQESIGEYRYVYIYMVKLNSDDKLGNPFYSPLTNLTYKIIKRNVEGEVFNMLIEDRFEMCPELKELTVMSLDYVKKRLSRYRVY